MDIFEKYPKIKEDLTQLLQSKLDEILNELLKSDDEYKELVMKRAKASMTLKNIIAESETENVLFEEYSDSIYAQEIYELNCIYKQGFINAINFLQKQDLL